MVDLVQVVESRAPPSVAAKLALAYCLLNEDAFSLIAPHLDKDRNSVDVGANRGIYTYFLARRSKHVFAYEPNPDVLRFLRCNARRNTTIRTCALSDGNGEAELHIPIRHNGREVSSLARLGGNFREDYVSQERKVVVPIRRLDDEDLENVGFIKIDVEGFEESVLRGGQALIRRDRPAMLIEIEQERLDKPILDVVRWVENMDYTAYFVQKNKLTPVAEFDPQLHQAVVSKSTPFKGRRKVIAYCNNFLFVPS